MLKIPVGCGCTFDGLKVFWTTLFILRVLVTLNWYAKSALALQLSTQLCNFHWFVTEMFVIQKLIWAVILL